MIRPGPKKDLALANRMAMPMETSSSRAGGSGGRIRSMSSAALSGRQLIHTLSPQVSERVTERRRFCELTWTILPVGSRTR